MAMARVMVRYDRSAEARRIVRRIASAYPINVDWQQHGLVVEVPELDDDEAREAVLALVGEFPYGPAPVSLPYGQPLAVDVHSPGVPATPGAHSA